YGGPEAPPLCMPTVSVMSVMSAQETVRIGPMPNSPALIVTVPPPTVTIELDAHKLSTMKSRITSNRPKKIGKIIGAWPHRNHTMVLQRKKKSVVPKAIPMLRAGVKSKQVPFAVGNTLMVGFVGRSTGPFGTCEKALKRSTDSVGLSLVRNTGISKKSR